MFAVHRPTPTRHRSASVLLMARWCLTGVPRTVWGTVQVPIVSVLLLCPQVRVSCSSTGLWMCQLAVPCLWIHVRWKGQFSRIVSLSVLSVSPWSLQRPKDIMVAVGFFDCVATPNYNEVIRYYFNSLRFFCEFMDLTLKHFRSWDDPKQEPSRMLPSKWGVEGCEEIRYIIQRYVPEPISVIQFGE